MNNPDLVAISSAKCKEMLNEHLTALSVVLRSNQSYTIGGRSLTRANIKDIQAGIEYWRTMYLNALETERIGRRGIVGRAVITHG